MIQVNYGNGYIVQVRSLQTHKKYKNGAMVVEALTIEECLVLSINIDIESLALREGEFFAKNHSEGKPLYDALLAAGWIEETGLTTKPGFVEIPAVKLTDKAIILW